MKARLSVKKGNGMISFEDVDQSFKVEVIESGVNSENLFQKVV